MLLRNFYVNKMPLLNSLLVDKNSTNKILKYIKLCNRSHSNRCRWRSSQGCPNQLIRSKGFGLIPIPNSAWCLCCCSRLWFLSKFSALRTETFGQTWYQFTSQRFGHIFWFHGLKRQKKIPVKLLIGQSLTDTKLLFPFWRQQKQERIKSIELFFFFFLKYNNS